MKLKEKYALAIDLLIACAVVALVMLACAFAPASHSQTSRDWGAVYHGKDFVVHLNKSVCPATIKAMVPEEFREKDWHYGFEQTFMSPSGQVYVRETHEVCWMADTSDFTVAIYSTTGTFGWIKITKLEPDTGS